MQSNSRAPLLSATLRTDSCWITSACLFQNFGHAPADLLRDRPRLDDAHAITDAAALVVVHLETPRVTDDLLIEGVRLEDLHHHDHRLLHLVAHHHAVAGLATSARSDSRGRVSHRHSPDRRRYRRPPPRAQGTRRREPLPARLQEPAGAARPLLSAWWASALQPSPGWQAQPRLRAAARDGGRARSRSSRSSSARSHDGSHA